MMRRAVLVFLLCLSLSLVLAATSNIATVASPGLPSAEQDDAQRLSPRNGLPNLGLVKPDAESLFVPGQFIVRMKDGATHAAAQSLAQDLGDETAKTITFPTGLTFYVLHFPEGTDDEASFSSLQAHPMVVSAARNARMHILQDPTSAPTPSLVPNDEFFRTSGDYTTRARPEAAPTPT